MTRLYQPGGKFRNFLLFAVFSIISTSSPLFAADCPDQSGWYCNSCFHQAEAECHARASACHRLTADRVEACMRGCQEAWRQCGGYLNPLCLGPLGNCYRVCSSAAAQANATCASQLEACLANAQNAKNECEKIDKDKWLENQMKLEKATIQDSP